MANCYLELTYLVSHQLDEHGPQMPADMVRRIIQATVGLEGRRSPKGGGGSPGEEEGSS